MAYTDEALTDENGQDLAVRRAAVEILGAAAADAQRRALRRRGADTIDEGGEFRLHGAFSR